jgi:hypothetical protein
VFQRVPYKGVIQLDDGAGREGVKLIIHQEDNKKEGIYIEFYHAVTYSEFS